MAEVQISNRVGNYLRLTGGQLSGPLTTYGIKISQNIDYGDMLPETGSEGQIFFQMSEPYYELPPGGTANYVLAKRTNDNRDVQWSNPVDLCSSSFVLKTGDIMTDNLTVNKTSSEAQIRVAGASGNLYLYATASTAGNRGIYGFNSSGTGQSMFSLAQNGDIRAGGKLYGAVWNDYAEFRRTKDVIEPGRCIKEVGNGTLELTTSRLEKGSEIVSDTFGFAIGQSEKCKTPVAISGRVLAYLYEDKEIAKQNIGQAVCSGPNGTVSIMTDKECQLYPQCIIGTISEIPDYKTWDAGSNGDTSIQVNNRIWIRVR